MLMADDVRWAGRELTHAQTDVQATILAAQIIHVVRPL